MARDCDGQLWEPVSAADGSRAPGMSPTNSNTGTAAAW